MIVEITIITILAAIAIVSNLVEMTKLVSSTDLAKGGKGPVATALIFTSFFTPVVNLLVLALLLLVNRQLKKKA